MIPSKLPTWPWVPWVLPPGFWVKPPALLAAQPLVLPRGGLDLSFQAHWASEAPHGQPDPHPNPLPQALSSPGDAHFPVSQPFPGSLPLEIALQHPIAIKLLYSMSIGNPDLHRVWEGPAARAMSEQRGFNGPDQPPPTSPAPFQCRAGQSLGCVWPWLLLLPLILTLTGIPPWTCTGLIITDFPGVLLSDPDYHPQGCPACPARGCGDGALASEAPALLALLSHSFAASLFLRDHLTPIAPWRVSFHSSFAFVFAKPSFCVHTASHLFALRASSFSSSRFNPSSHLLTVCFPLAVHSWLCESWSGASVVWRH